MTKARLRKKIRLSAGASSAEFLDVMEKLKGCEVLFSLPPDVPVLTQMTFLSQLKKAAEEGNTKLRFLTRKKYYQELLEKKGFEVVEKTPEDFEDVPLEKWMVYTAKIEAQKNESRQKPADVSFRPKVSKKHPSFQTSSISSAMGSGQRPLRGIYFFSVVFLVLLLLGIWAWIVPHATIVIKPRVSAIPVTQNVILRLPQAEIPEEESQLPSVDAIYVDTVVQGSESFPTLDRKYEVTNAYGEVTLFNETREPKYLLPSRLSSPEGYIFRFAEEVVIPPANADGPGTLVVSVKADGFTADGDPIGAAGNIEAGTDLFFPALRRETRELYYAKANRGPLVGGSTLTRYFMGAEDIEKAKPMLVETFEVRGKQALEQELLKRSSREKTEYLLIDHPDLLQSELIEFTAPLDSVGSEQETFEMSGKLKLQGIVFSRDEVLDILRDKIIHTQDHRKKLLDLDRTSFEYRILRADEAHEENWVKLSVSVMGVEAIDFEADNAFAAQWRTDLIRDIAGKSISEAKSILTNHLEIEDIVALRLRPFWIKQMPSLYDQIELRVAD